jgi:hypothetical protein
MPEFLINANGFDLGLEDSVGNVVLPPWAHGSPHEFIAIHHQALESPFVSAHLHEWIDLIFGDKQNGPEAVKAKNTFQDACYQSAVTPEIANNPSILIGIQEMARNVGMIPHQLFDRPHPPKTIIGVIPTFSEFTIEGICILQSLPKSVSVSGSRLYFVDEDCAVWYLRIRKGSVPIKIGSIHPYVPNQAVTNRRSFVLLPAANRFVASWDNAFHVFEIDSTSITHIDAIRQRFSRLLTLTSPGGSLLLTAWRDASVRLSDLSVPGCPDIYRIMPHLTSIVDIDVSHSAEIISSVDKERNCVLSMLSNGKRLRSFVIDGTDELQRVFIFGNGYVAFISHNVVRVYGIDGRKLAEETWNDKVLDWVKAEFQCALDCLVISFESKRLLVLRMPHLGVMLDIVTDVQFITLKFWRAMNSFIALAPNNTLWTFGSFITHPKSMN